MADLESRVARLEQELQDLRDERSQALASERRRKRTAMIVRVVLIAGLALAYGSYFQHATAMLY